MNKQNCDEMCRHCPHTQKGMKSRVRSTSHTPLQEVLFFNFRNSFLFKFLGLYCGKNTAQQSPRQPIPPRNLTFPIPPHDPHDPRWDNNANIVKSIDIFVCRLVSRTMASTGSVVHATDYSTRRAVTITNSTSIKLNSWIEISITASYLKIPEYRQKVMSKVWAKQR